MECHHDPEIKALKTQIGDLTSMLSCYQDEYLGPQATVLATNKVIELSKRNRHLTAELESTRTKCNHLNKQCLQLEAKLQAVVVAKPQELEPPPESELDRLTDEVRDTKTKLFEALNTNTSLKNELKLAHKYLEQEIGQPVNLKALAIDTNWRGRSQTILALQQKVADLKGSHPVQPNPSATSLRKFEEFELCKKESANLRQLCDEQKFKMAALKSRNQILAEEVANGKQKCAELMEKVASDAQKITALKSQIEELTFERECENLPNQDKVDAGQKFEDLMQELRTKDTKIEELTTRMAELEQDVESLAGDFLFKCRDLKKEQFLAMLEALEQQNSALSQQLAEEVKTLGEERAKQKKQIELAARQKTRITRLEAKIRDSESPAPVSKKKETSQRPSMQRTTLSAHVSPAASRTKITAPPNSRSDSSDMLTTSVVVIQDLKFKLEYTQEQMRMLEQSFKEVVAEKEGFCKYFCDLIAKTREIFLNSLVEKQ